ncbi:MAG: HAD-IIB family hydrolase [Planctomycetes bacterium]|nr:HAD-IIB family hydrolase [Planctomycetota bacterium]
MASASPPVSIRLLALDVDGTVTNSRHEVTDRVCRGLARVRAAGVHVMLATGRRYRDVLPVAEQLAIAEPLVTASGALVKRPADHVTLARAAFPDGLLAGVLTTVVGLGHEPVVYTDSFSAGFDFHCRSLAPAEVAEPADVLGRYLLRNRGVAIVTPDLHERPPADAFACFVVGEQEPMAALERRLAARFGADLAVHSIRSPRYEAWFCEIAPRGVTKWSGVAAVAASRGINAAEVCAVGDDVNDLPMVRAAGLGVAMANARPELLAVADVVVGGHDDRGIEDVVELVLSRAAQPAPPA